MNSRNFLHSTVYFFVCLLLFVFIFQFLLPQAQARFKPEDFQKEEIQAFHYVAIGDSLTEGVGDTTNQGGFVPLLAQSLVNSYGYQVNYDNYGLAGNTSQQILKRMTEESEIGQALKTADLLTLTVGGNDLRHIILKNIANLSISTFDQPLKAYSQRLKDILQTARQHNPDLPIYVLGIYNPLYLSFPEMTDMQTIVDNWNQVTEETVTSMENVYFVPINDLLYKGLDGQEGVAETNSSTSSGVNNLLYEEDSFHPNNTGYEIMKQAVMEAISETKENW